MGLSATCIGVVISAASVKMGGAIVFCAGAVASSIGPAIVAVVVADDTGVSRAFRFSRIAVGLGFLAVVRAVADSVLTSAPATCGCCKEICAVAFSAVFGDNVFVCLGSTVCVGTSMDSSESGFPAVACGMAGCGSAKIAMVFFSG